LALKRSEKETIVQTMGERLGRATAIVMADYRGLSVADLTGLRGAMRANGCDVQVIKNTLMLRACQEADIEPPTALMKGPTAIVLLYDDLASPTKALLEFAKKHERFEIRGGVLDGKMLDAGGVKSLAELPSRDELRAMFLGTLQAPQRQLVTVLGAPLRSLVTVLSAYADKDADKAA
jgi:large subunit ribosomal protein L10